MDFFFLSRTRTLLSNFFQEPVDDDRNRMRTDHALVVVPPERPDGKVSRPPALLEHRVHEPRRALRGEYRVERMRGAESVPSGKRGIERLVSGVGDVVRLEEKMVERSIEASLRRFVRARNLDDGKAFVPRRARGRLHLVKSAPRKLRSEIALRRRNAIR